MPLADIVILGGIIAAFVVFAAVLAWASHAEKTASRVPPPAKIAPFTARHA